MEELEPIEEYLDTDEISIKVKLFDDPNYVKIFRNIYPEYLKRI